MMEKIYTVKTTSQAEEQMQEIIHYIAYELKAPDAAFICWMHWKTLLYHLPIFRSV